MLELKGVEEELKRRENLIERNLQQAKENDLEENNRIKTKIEENYLNIEELFGTPNEITKSFEKLFKDLIRLVNMAFDDDDDKMGKRFLKEYSPKVKECFLSVFNKKRANALVNILQPANTRVYEKEGIRSLRFSKEEILKGFSVEEVEKQGITETQVKTSFWMNKLTKLVNLKEIDKLKSKPISYNSEENYFFASKRLEILKLLEGLNEEDANSLKEKYADEYLKTFGVSIDSDCKTIDDYVKMRENAYVVKNIMLGNLIQRYLFELKQGNRLSGIQAMGIMKNTSGYSYTQGGTMAVIRLKGYTSNIYLHLPYILYENILKIREFNGIPMVVPSLIYSQYDSEKLIPTNVICKVEIGSKRHKSIQEECKLNPNNEILQQAERQIRISNLKPKDTKNWIHTTTDSVLLDY